MAPGRQVQEVLGVEVDEAGQAHTQAASDAIRLKLPQHVRLTAVAFRDQTDRYNELVHEQDFLLHPSERVALQGNLFAFEEVTSGRGWLAMKAGPLPHARAVPSEADVHVQRDDPGFVAAFSDSDGYPWQIVEYVGGRLGRARALRGMQRPAPQRLTRRLLCNTWGDRSRDARMTEAFVLDEIGTAGRLGVDVVQLDDGWQKGTSSNSAQAKERGGVWAGFYASDPDFWTPRASAFPNGLEPLCEAAARKGVELGLWFAPDSSNAFANWRRDVETLAGLHRRYGVKHFKFDAIVTDTPEAEANLSRLFDALQREAPGIVVDLDITAGTRPGYFGRMDHGPLFVANRYTDWHNHWPHHTARVLWRLSRWIEPARLRIEWLNGQRNADRYADDPLAPHAIDAQLAFAPLMFAQPLAWCEVSNLPAETIERLRPLICVWRGCREALDEQTVLPIGEAPDGVATSGFVSVGDDEKHGHLLVMQGLAGEQLIDWPTELPDALQLERLAGEGDLTLRDGRLFPTGLAVPGFWFGRYRV